MPVQQSSSPWQASISFAHVQTPWLQWRRAQQSASIEHALADGAQLEHLPPMQLPAQQSTADAQVEPGFAHGRQWPFMHARPSQHSLSLLHVRSIPWQTSKQRPKRHSLPEQHAEGWPSAPQGSFLIAQPGTQVPCGPTVRSQLNWSQHSPFSRHPSLAALQRGGPHVPPTHAPLQHLRDNDLQEAPSARHPSGVHWPSLQAKSSQHSASLRHLLPMPTQEHLPLVHRPEQQPLSSAQLS